MYFWPKNGQNGQKRNFHDTTLPFNDSKQLSPVSDQVLDKSDVRIRRKCAKTWFFGQKWQKLPVFGQNLENENFFQKSAWNIFLVLPRCNFGQSFRKIWCADLQISRRARTDGRTDGRTDERESIGPSANAERPKKGKKMAPIFCLNKNFHWPFLNNKLSTNNKN